MKRSAFKKNWWNFLQLLEIQSALKLDTRRKKGRKPGCSTYFEEYRKRLRAQAQGFLELDDLFGLISTGHNYEGIAFGAAFKISDASMSICVPGVPQPRLGAESARPRKQ